MRRWLIIFWFLYAGAAFAYLPQVTYTRGLDLSASLQGAGGIGGLLARTDHAMTNAQFATAYYHADGAGNITALVNTNGLIVARYAYDPFGRLLGKWGPLANVNPYRFSSKPHLPHAEDSYDYTERIWLANLQRWSSPDPLGEAGDLNLYRGMFNSPLNFVDRDGLDNIYAPTAGQNAPVNVVASMGLRGGAVEVAYGGTDALMLMLMGYVPGGGLAQDLLFGIPNDLGQLASSSEPTVERVGAGLRLGGRAILAAVTGKQLAARPPVKTPCPTSTARGTPTTKPSLLLPERAGPTAHISPNEVIGRTPAQIEARAKELGLQPRGPAPATGRGAYIDPETGVQRILSHPNESPPHGHVNNPAGLRIGPDGSVVPQNSPDAHLPIKYP